MKNIYKVLLMACVAVLAASCADFDEVNTNPKAISALVTKPYYALNKSIISDQQNPNDAERVFVINWCAIARQDGEDGYNHALGNQSDDYVGCLYSLCGNTIKSAVNAMELVDKQLAAGVGEHEAEFLPNVKEFARIWRVQLMTEFADSFGPMPTQGFQGENPEFNSLKEVYYYMYDELKDAVSKINVNVVPTTEEAKCDPAYGYDAAKWKKFGISLWMRLAMRLSEVDPAKAKSEFEAAVQAGPGITTVDELFGVKEKSGWDDLSGVMSRVWDWQETTATFANLTTNFGGAKAADILADPTGIFYPKQPDVAATYGKYIKDANTYLGRYAPNSCEANTDNPTRGVFFDGIPANIDPRSFEFFCMGSDLPNRIENSYWYPNYKKYYVMATGFNDADGNAIEASAFDATCCWNGMPAGIWADEIAANAWGPINQYANSANQNYFGTYPALADKYRNNTQSRFYFGPWETYFLLAEAALRGWNVGTTAETAYNQGIKVNFQYYKMDHLYNAYVNSENYNRVGTSVKFSHTAEPANVEMDYIDAYTGTAGKMTYKYPDANKILYKGHKLNDQLTKIITQKFIANTPYLPLENWCEHRRLGLPFWEIPASTKEISWLPGWKKTSYQTGQTAGCYPQRMKYPSSLNNADPKEYQHALELLGGENLSSVPLWWAIGGN